MSNKQKRVKATVLLERCGLIAITETWWDESHDWSVVIDGHRLFRRDRWGKRGGHKVKQRKFHLNMRKNFFHLRVTEPWNRLPREVVESHSLEIFKTRLDSVLCSLL